MQWCLGRARRRTSRASIAGPRRRAASAHAAVLCIVALLHAPRWANALPPPREEAALAADADGAAPDDCWDNCRTYGLFCEAFCCQPLDGVGNPTCWDFGGHFSYERCCTSADVKAIVEPPEAATPPTIVVGSVTMPLYRGPITYNSPKINERTLEIALALWFMRRCYNQLVATGGGYVPYEIGNVLGSYWPPEERVFGNVLPWTVLDLGDNGQDATFASFDNISVLSISTVEHIGFDNQGVARVEGVHVGTSDQGLEKWIRAWDAAPALLTRIAREASQFLVTFPIGVNPHLDGFVARSPWTQRISRVAYRVDAANNWRIDPTGRLDYKYDYRDTYDAEYMGYMYDPRLAETYERVYGQAMFAQPLPLPLHPPFRWANAICIVTNMRELLA